MPSTAEDRSGRTGFLFALAALIVIGVIVATAVVLKPDLLAAVLPSWSAGRALQVYGVVLLLMPIVAALVAGVRGRRRASGWFDVLTLVVLLPAAAAIRVGINRVHDVNRDNAPATGACVERSGGDTTCPGG